jgi:hypothetical protein
MPRRAGDRAHLQPAKLNGPPNMRDRDTVDAELRLLAAVRRSIREQGCEPSSRQVDELLDERLTVSGQAEGFEPSGV